jgi:hypothetical protein
MTVGEMRLRRALFLYSTPLVTTRLGGFLHATRRRKTTAPGLSQLPPGNYKLLAVPVDDADLIMASLGRTEPDLTDYEDAMKSVEIHGAENVTLDLKRQNAASLDTGLAREYRL